MKANEYVWIRRWGLMMGSFDYYITEQQRDAAAADAPATAIHRDHDTKEWRTVENVTNLSTLNRLRAFSDDAGVTLLNEIYERVADPDLPEGCRWATAEETEALSFRSATNLPADVQLIHRTADANGVPYTHDEADVAVPINWSI